MDADVLGRGRELGTIARLLDGQGIAGLTFTGEPGIGKSTLWEAGLDIAAARGWRTLRARVGEAGAAFGFGVLADLFAGIELDDVRLDPPVRQALAAAMLREVPAEPITATAVARGTTAVLQALATQGPLLIAIDDVQWSDAESTQALAQAARSLAGGRLRFVFTRRSGESATPIESVLQRRELDVVDVGPLSHEMVPRLLVRRLDLALPRWLGVRVADHARGNPLFALEIGRVLRDRPLPPFGAPLPVPTDLADLFAQRVAHLPAPERDLLLATAAEPLLGDGDLVALGDAETLARALDDRLLLIDPDTGRVRPAHPLLAATAWTAAGPETRRALHRRLAAVLGDTERGVRHRALGSHGYDDRLAALLDRAAEQAAAAGRAETAVELARLTLDRTTPDCPDRPERVLRLAERMSVAGVTAELTALLDHELTALPAGDLRARGWLLATDGEVESIARCLDYIDRAIADASHAPTLRAEALSLRATVMAVAQVRHIQDAVHLAERAVELDPEATLGASWARAMAGLPDSDRVDDVTTASRRCWRGDVAGARRLLTARIAADEECGGHADFLAANMLLTEVELRAGRLDRATELLEVVEAFGYAEAFDSPDHLRLQARLAALRGRRAEAEQWLGATRPLARAVDSGWVLLDLSITEGLVATCAGDPSRAATALGEVWDWCRREGVGNPGAFPVAFELAAARLAVGEADAAWAVADQLRAAADAQQHPWALAVTRALDALRGAVEGSHAPGVAAAVATQAADELRAMGLAFDAARVLTVVGAALRRRRQWGHARTLLEAASAELSEIGADGWVALVGDELGKVGGRRRTQDGALTPAELATARLAADGLSNQQVARRTGTSVRTVETHLSRAYQKLGITARSQLATALAPRTEPVP
ncbi:LuxR family transcriptional regulator [Nocardioides carbamazepini]|uniref:helix-turn-helix transcriptional regulator n=1 Tax=Nocardioides carbamazepini TaxID=2854259 RepID=UPI00214A7ED8|nr:LuxR family transcriptional regulator [Nocardioides carbamazepini]MCR1783836.1 LuxR family transcriptional regulator [Nocardioides carbamazepini]